MNQTIYRHPGQEQMQVEIILASRHTYLPDEKPLVTMRWRYPRIIHGEIMTHRVFSRNARSSRAVPVKTMLNEVRNTPFVPWHWGKNQKGMQAGENLSKDQIELAEYIWDCARLDAIGRVEALTNLGLHKQIPNRLLEPFSWIDTLITANDWDNFLWLRDHGDAEPHLQDLARLVKQALDEMDVQELKPGEWHTPYVDKGESSHIFHHLAINRITRDRPNRKEVERVINQISAARCARMSYRPFDGDASYERELERYESLVTADRVHASPTEHQATPDERESYYICGVDENKLVITDNADLHCGWQNPHLHGNLPGWIQFRKTIPGEHHRG
jgi:thymidylate synthase ThyX